MKKEGWGAGMPVCPWEQGLCWAVTTGEFKQNLLTESSPLITEAPGGV